MLPMVGEMHNSTGQEDLRSIENWKHEKLCEQGTAASEALVTRRGRFGGGLRTGRSHWIICVILPAQLNPFGTDQVADKPDARLRVLPTSFIARCS